MRRMGQRIMPKLKIGTRQETPAGCVYSALQAGRARLRLGRDATEHLDTHGQRAALHVQVGEEHPLLRERLEVSSRQQLQLGGHP